MRKIIHVDMDCFFAAVEMRDNPALRDIPIAIGGSRERRGVISTANYPARQFGVRSAMPTAMALKLCPHLTLLPGRFDAYKEASRHVRDIFSRYTSLIEPLSLDEAWLDVTDSPHCYGSATLIAREIRQTIFNELQLTASAGVAPVKFLAKIASDLNKPNGQYVITPADVPDFLKTLPLAKIPGVGKVSAAAKALSSSTIWSIPAAPPSRFAKCTLKRISSRFSLNRRAVRWLMIMLLIFLRTPGLSSPGIWVWYLYRRFQVVNQQLFRAPGNAGRCFIGYNKPL